MDEPTLRGRSSSAEGRLGGEPPIELRRHLDALRRRRVPIAVFVLGTAAIVLAISLALPESYRASATIVREDPAAILSSKDVQSIERELETIGELITTPALLDRAASRMGLEGDEIEDKVEASVASDANIIRIAVTDRDPARAAQIANAVATEFLEGEREAEQRRLDLAEARLRQELDELRARGGAAAEIEAVRARLSELAVQQAGVGSEFQLVQRAEPPTDAVSPRPVRDTLLALFAALFLAVLAALARDQLVPRAGSPRDLSRLMDLPVLGGIPIVRRRARRRPFTDPAEHEAYQTLQASLRFQLPPDEQRVILVTSALAGEGKTTVTANLGRALARAGDKTLLVSADLRRPKLHELFGVAQQPGLVEVLEGANDRGDASNPGPVVQRAPNARGNLHILASGGPAQDPLRTLYGDGLDPFLKRVRKSAYSYVLIDSPPLLGLADAHVLARHVDAIVLVGRLDRLTLDNVAELRALLDRLELEPLGMVVVGGRRESSYYYYSRQLPIADEAEV